MRDTGTCIDDRRSGLLSRDRLIRPGMQDGPRPLPFTGIPRPGDGACSVRSSTFRVPSSAFRVRGSGFTLIELLVVIIIIGILVSIITGAVQSVIRDRKIAQAKAEVQAIAIATEEYRRQFGEIPLATNWYDPNSWDVGYVEGLSSNSMAGELYNRLIGSNATKVVFLKIQRVEGVNSTNGVLRDPWGNPYDFYLDSNYDRRIDLGPYQPAGGYCRIVQDITIFVRSRGPDRRAGNEIYYQNDDITWPPLDSVRFTSW